MTALLRELLQPARDGLRLAVHRANWRGANPGNFTTAGTLFPFGRVSVGDYTYGRLNLYFFGHPGEEVQIGSFCSIADDVTILAGGEHPFDRPTSYPLERHVAGLPDVGSGPKGPVVIGDDVWIGRGCIILSGVTIGQGAVLGAGSIVAKDVPAYAIHAGGRVLRNRFPDEQLVKLKAFDWSGLHRAEIVANLKLLTTPLAPDFFDADVYRRHLRESGDGDQ